MPAEDVIDGGFQVLRTNGPRDGPAARGHCMELGDLSCGDLHEHGDLLMAGPQRDEDGAFGRLADAESAYDEVGTVHQRAVAAGHEGTAPVRELVGSATARNLVARRLQEAGSRPLPEPIVVLDHHAPSFAPCRPLMWPGWNDGRVAPSSGGERAEAVAKTGHE